MNRTKYKNEYIKNKYDRLEVVLPKGKKSEIKNMCKNLNISINEYINMLISNDMQSGNSQINISDSNVDIELLRKWQIPKKYQGMIEYASYSKESGYFIRLKDGYINDTSGTRIINVKGTNEMRLTINKSHSIK
ncbi:hypothetical protein [Peptostreptococcus equinus]|uniref:Uncharacterized protein n=1 Tax=Peptostreptococcus equinus TaxID=3003601 RepID=A0ABY7JQJ0_9FIRM|nr:hypothetical protein [Peptostreptococcus sp. CBA3647]WAW14776.1 hypothetical protein O0R46_09355 [Peptostreptococcus sp. CBA3647]